MKIIYGVTAPTEGRIKRAGGGGRQPRARGTSMSAIFAYLVLTLQANQVASGLALAIFGVGLSAFVGKPYESETLKAVPPLKIPLLSDIPLIGPALFSQQWLLYFSWLLLAGVIWFLFKTRAGSYCASLANRLHPRIRSVIG